MVQAEKSADCSNSQVTGENMGNPDNNDGMVKSERQELVLQFMEDHPLAMPPTVIYRNLRVHRNLRVGYETLKNYLDEFHEEGLVLRVDKKSLDDGEIVEADADDRAYYVISDEGREWLRNDD